MKIVATIEARMTSTRLPGKVLLPAKGKPLLHHMVSRLRAVPSIHKIVLATTTNATDDVLEEFAHHEEIGCFRGSEQDVMGRVVGAAESVGAEAVTALTGDCPIIDPQIVEQVIRMFLVHVESDPTVYVSNSKNKSYPDGMDIQIFRLESLQQSAAMTTDPLDREHVTLHMCNHPELFTHIHLVAAPKDHWPGLGLTLDEPDDYELLTSIIEHFGTENPLFGCHEVVKLLRDRPDLVAINQNVRRKGNT